MNLKHLEARLNSLYKPEKITDHAPAGLLIEGSPKVRRGVTAVSFCSEIIEHAAECCADFIIVHHPHGFWSNQPRVLTGRFGSQVSRMIKLGMSLFGFHLAMDIQPRLGNNAGIAKALRLLGIKPLDCLGVPGLGVIGSFRNEIKISVLESLSKKVIGSPNFFFPFGSKIVKKVAVCSGGGAGAVQAAMASGAQVLITGEAKEETFLFCREEKFNLIAAGHHQTEVFGPRLLAEYLSKQLELPTEFIDLPNPV